MAPPAPRFAALLAGDHATLPAAEVRSLVAVHSPRAVVEVDGPIAIVSGGEPAGIEAALARAAMVHAYGRLWGLVPAGPDAGQALAHAVQRHADGVGTAGVHSERRGHAKNPDVHGLVRATGDALKAAGHAIELTAPERRVFLWLCGNAIAVGERLGTPPAAASPFEARAVEERGHFSPVSLHPRRAAALLHLAEVPLRQPAPPSRGSGGSAWRAGRILDPFCGTGGFVLEAALEGYEAIGSDLDPFMVQGTLSSLADVAAEPLEALVFEADIALVADLVDAVDGIVTDLPYGRASTTGGEGLEELYRRAFATFAAVLRRGGRAVVGAANADLMRLGEAAGLERLEMHEERVHRSLTRHFTVFRKR